MNREKELLRLKKLALDNHRRAISYYDMLEKLIEESKYDSSKLRLVNLPAELEEIAIPLFLNSLGHESEALGERIEDRKPQAPEGQPEGQLVEEQHQHKGHAYPERAAPGIIYLNTQRAHKQ